MDSTTLLIIVLIVLLVGGGGWYGRGRSFSVLCTENSNSVGRRRTELKPGTICWLREQLQDRHAPSGKHPLLEPGTRIVGRVSPRRTVVWRGALVLSELL